MSRSFEQVETPSFFSQDSPAPFEFSEELSNPVAQSYAGRLARGNHLRGVVDDLIGIGAAQSIPDAFQIINSLAESNSGLGNITTSDLDNNVRLQVTELFKPQQHEKSAGQESGRSKVIQRHGSISHAVIPKIFTSQYASPLVESAPSAAQQVLFDMNNLHSEDVESTDESGNLREEFVDKVFDTWVSLLEQFEENPMLPYINSEHARRMRNLLESVLPSETREISTHVQGEPRESLPLLTYMTWANAIVSQFGRHPKALFCEKQISHTPTHHINAGRADAIEVAHIRGDKPDPEQTERIRELTEKRYSSIGSIVNDVVKQFGDDVDFSIIDWKLAVGDYPKGKKVMELDDLESPFNTHLKQVKRYLTFASMDSELLGGFVPSTGKMVRNYFPNARLIYFHPFSEKGPIEFSIDMDETDKQGYVSEVAMHWQRTKRNRDLRALDRALRDTLLGKMTDKPIQIAHPSAMEMIIDSQRQFVDDEQIIEVVGFDNKTNKPKFALDFGKIYEKVVNGEIGISGSLDRLGHGNVLIQCPFPDHEDSTPSAISNGVDRLHCFGCGKSGYFELHSIPKEFSYETAERVKTHHSRNPTKAELAVPPEHHMVMSHLQKRLEDMYPGSRAERYVTAVRGIDPGLAEYFGVGSGDNRVILQLLHDGMSIEDMYKYGILVPSERVDENSQLVRMLTDAGLPLQEIMGKIGNKNGEEVWGLPNFKLSGRVTFPLENPGDSADGIAMISSVYGRIARDDLPKSVTHRKLNKRSNVAHGVFNPTPFYSDSSKMIVTEGVFDALTLIQMGYEDTVAIVGTHHNLLMERIASTGKEVGIALDNDDIDGQGFKATVAMEQLLQNLGCTREISDFTADFIEEHPDFAPYDDFNTYLQVQKGIKK